jgi:hypothetical protein
MFRATSAIRRRPARTHSEGNEINEKNELRGTERGDLIRLIRLIRPLAESGERTERLADEQAAAPRAARHTIEQEGVQCR